jgi:pyridoxine kinase
VNILSIQSSVTRGHVGNSVAVMALQCLGHDAWPIDTVTFSNHPGHGGFRGRVTDAALIGELVAGLIEHGGLRSCDAVLSGYLGALDQGPALIAAVAAARGANPNALFALDPVIGDGGPQGGRIYVKPGIAEFLRDHAMPQADIATPNAFELEFLSGLPARDTGSALAAIDRLRARMGGSTRPGGALVVATGMSLDDQPGKTLSILGADAGGAWRIGHPAVDHPAYGAGDLFAALLLGRLLNGEAASDAAALAAVAVHLVIERTAVDGNKDLRVVPNRRELVTPSQSFAIERVR